MSYFGAEWEMQVSEAKCKKYLNGKDLPKMGYQTDLIVKRDEYGFMCHLTALNVSGTYFIACSNVERKYWPEFFGFTLYSA